MLRIILIIGCCFFLQQMDAQKALYPVKIEGKWGLIDSVGQLVVKPMYERVGMFDESGISIVQKGDLLGAIDQYGQEKLPCKYQLLEHLGKGFFSIKLENTWKVVGEGGRVVLEQSSGKVEVLNNGYLTFETLEGKGLAHIGRGVVLPAKYEKIDLRNLPYLVVQDTNALKGVFDNTGKELMSISYDRLRFYPSIIIGQKSKKWGIFTPKGDCLLETVWESYRFIGDQFIYLHKRGESCLFSIAENKIVANGFHDLFAFNDQYILFSGTDGKVGLYDQKGNIVFKARYETILPYTAQSFRIQLDGLWGIFDMNGKEIAGFEYAEIGELDSTVALVQKEGQYGVMDKNGLVVLDIEYGEPLPLTMNNIRYQTPNGGLQMMFFGTNGELETHTKYNKFRSLKAKNRLEVRMPNLLGGGGNQLLPPSTINDSLEWFMDFKTRKWGIRNIATRRVKIPAQYDSYNNCRDLGFSIAEIVKPKIGGVFSLDGLEIKVNKIYGIINNSRGLPVTRMEFTDIRLNDFRGDSLPIARCVFVGGKHGLIAKNGKVLMRSCAFIGDFKEGKARLTQKGTLTSNSTGEMKRHVGKSGRYLGSLMSGYTFDGLNNPRDEALLVDKGVLYVNEAKWGFVDTNGVIVVDCKYDYVDNFSNDRAMVQQKNQWGLIDDSGDEILPIQYDDMNFLKNSEKNLFFITQHDQKYGCIDSNARVVVAPKYERVKGFKEGMMAVKRSNRWGFVNAEGVEVIPCEYRAVHDFCEGLAAVSVKGRWGYINKEGSIVIKPKYARAGDFSEGKAWARISSAHMGYIDPNGNVLFKGKYQQLTDFEEGIARFKVFKKGWGLLSASGEVILKAKKAYKKIDAFNEYGLAKVKIGKKYGILNKEGKLLTKHLFALIKDFSEGHAVVRRQAMGGNSLIKKNSDLGFIDTTGALIGKIQYRQLGDFHDGRAKYRTNKGWGFINIKGEMVIQPIYSKVIDFEDGRAVVYRSYNKSGIVDTLGNYIINPKVNRITNIGESLALVRQDYSNYFFIHEDLKRHTATNFQKAYPFSNGAAPVKSAGKWGVINEKGVVAMIPKYNKIDAYQNNYAKVMVNDWKGVVDVDGKVIIKPEYEYIAYAGNGLFRVEQENKVGYLNVEGNWVWPMNE
ncbi:MAG: WG repeat-containing protein [Aureispira sp.]|nr:WG repeat-containing protein [Aureispira sp.]